jgi:hypothetical protein
MAEPTPTTLLADLTTTREADQNTRLDLLLAIRWAAFVGAPLSVVALVVAVVWGAR